MKKLFSIVFAALILLSGMHLTLATHFCGGELAGVKLSLSGEKANCGMEMPVTEALNQISIASESCCKDEIAALNVDKNYNPSVLQLKEPAKVLLQVFCIPASTGILCNHKTSLSHASIRPPGNYLPKAVALADICVFRI